MPKKIRVAAVQMDCRPGDVAHNLAHAETMAESAAEQGSEIVLLPELMPSGYMVTEEIWKSAETINGHSIDWLLSTASRFGVYLGFSFLEADGEDFYNSFVLASPAGKLLGRVRKNPPASIEAYFYKAGFDRHVIETELGRIGVGICYENLLYEQMCSIYRENVDLVLAPFAAGRPRPFIPGDIKRFDRILMNSRQVFAETLGVPVIVANRVGLLDTDLPGHLPHLRSSFPGLSSIVDYDGTVKAELGAEEGVIVADVHIGQIVERKGEPKRYGKMWGVPVPWYAFIWPLTQKWGEKSYASNNRRKERALAVSGSILPPEQADPTRAKRGVNMTQVRVEGFTISLDGYGAGPSQDLDHPLGVGGTELHQWAFPTRTFQRALFGVDGGTTGIDEDFAARGFKNIGAWILGRNMFGPIRGPWPDLNWKGWWGENPPYHVPVFVLTHHARPSIQMEGNTIFHFITGGIHEALELARKAANGMDVRIGGGPCTIRQYLSAGLIDEMHIAIAPVLLGSGERLFDEVDARALGYDCVQFVASEHAMHVVLRRQRAQ